MAERGRTFIAAKVSELGTKTHAIKEKISIRTKATKNLTDSK